MIIDTLIGEVAMKVTYANGDSVTRLTTLNVNNVEPTADLSNNVPDGAQMWGTPATPLAEARKQAMDELKKQIEQQKQQGDMQRAGELQQKLDQMKKQQQLFSKRLLNVFFFCAYMCV